MDHWTPDPGNVGPTAGLEQVGLPQAIKRGSPSRWYAFRFAAIHNGAWSGDYVMKKAGTQNDGCLDDLKNHRDIRGRSVIHDDDEFPTWSHPADATKGFVSDANVPYGTDDGATETENNLLRLVD